MERKKQNQSDGNLLQKYAGFLLITTFCILDMFYASTSATREEEILNFSAYPDL